MTNKSLIILSVIIAAVAVPPMCTSFSTAIVSSESLRQKDNQRASLSSLTTMSMGLFGVDSDGGSKNNNNFLKEMFQPKKSEQEDSGPKIVLTIPVDNIKPRPLRFFLQIYIVGQHNSKDSQTWLPRESADGGLQIYYKDGTGMCNIDLQANNIQIERHSQKPSLEYLLQESVMLHGVLDELHKIAFDVDDVKDGDKLVVLDKESIDKARETLPARRE